MLSEEFEEYLGAMYERAHQRFRESGESRLLRGRLDDCEAACLQNVHPNDHFSSMTCWRLLPTRKARRRNTSTGRATRTAWNP